jgi:CheY-like chemotaxis protein
MFYFDLQLKAIDGESIGWSCNHLKEYFRNILVVDDNENNSNIIVQMLKSEEVQTTTASNGLEALHMLANGNRFDVVLMDYSMPYLDGLETIRKIREELLLSEQEQPIIIFHSSSEDERIINGCKKYGIRSMLVKPITIQQLCNGLMKLTGKNKELTATSEQREIKKTAFAGKILIVEDNDINLILARTIVQDLLPQAKILEAENGEEAVRIFQTEQPDLVFMDIQMPVMNGYEAAVSIRKKTGSKVPIIALTAGTVKGEEEKCMQAGMNDYISKPVVQETIQKSLLKWLPVNEVKEIETTEKPESEEHFDFNGLLAKLNYDEQLTFTIIIKTSAYLDKTIVEMEETYKEKKYGNLNKIAHSLKGTSGSVCLNRLHLLSIDLMKFCNPPDRFELQHLLVEIAREIQFVKQSMADRQLDNKNHQM